jgi:conjugative transposon TraJ protein
MKNWKCAGICTVLGMILPLFSQAQGMAENIRGLQEVLDGLYDEMITMSGDLINVARGIAGFGALWYIASRVWRHIANAEPIDFYPLFRPFVLGFCITFFPFVLGTINFLMKPIVTGTAKMVHNSDAAITRLLKEKEEALQETDSWKMYVGDSKAGNRDEWYRYTHNNEDPKKETWYNAIGNDIKFALEKGYYNFRNSVKEWMSEILKVLFEAAALCINTLRTFQLIVLAILGPLVFGIAVFDGFQHTLTAWLAKYLNVFLWLPVANIFGAIIGKIQENMLKIDISQAKETGDTFFSTADVGYLVFMIIGIVGYFTVPSVANFIVNSGGGGAMGQKITSMVSSGASMATGRFGQGINNIADMKKNYNEGLSGKDGGSGLSGAIGRATGKVYMAEKLGGKSKGSPSKDSQPKDAT